MKKKNLLARVIIIVVVTLVGLYLVIGPRRRPNLRDFTWSGIKASLASNIRLGLDLQGGSHLVMRVKTDINTGVSISPRRVVITPARASPS